MAKQTNSPSEKTMDDISKNLLVSQLKETESTHFNSVVSHPTLISSGSLKLDSYVKIKTGSVIRIGGPAEVGKAESVNSKVLTPTGWKRMGDLKQGQLVIGSDGKAHQILGVYPQGKLKVNKVIFSDQTEVICCDEHLWLTREYSDRNCGRNGCVKTTHQLKKTLMVGNHYNHTIPYVKPIEFRKMPRPLPIHPYVFGALLGDGSFIKSIHGQNCVGFIASNLDILDIMSSFLKDSLFILQLELNYLFGYYFIFPNIRDILSSFNLNNKYCWEKHIPKEYLFSSIEDRKNLLMGLMDTGNGVSKNTSLEYSTSSKQLSEDVIFLARSLGARVTATDRIPSYHYNGVKLNGRKSYRIIISFSDFKPFKLKRKLDSCVLRTTELEKTIEDIQPFGEDECVCIKIDSFDSLYVTDGFNLTHNTSQSMLFAKNFMDTMPKSKTFYVNAEAKFGEEIQGRTGMSFTKDPNNWDYGSVFILDSNCFDTICDILVGQFKQIHEAGGHLCVIIDSVDMLRLKSSFDAKVSDDKRPAGVNYLTKELFRHLCHLITAYNGFLIMITQYSATFKLDRYAKDVPNLMEGNQTHALNHQAAYALYYQPRAASHYILENEKEKPDPIKNKILGVNAKIDLRKSSSDETGYRLEIPIKKGRIGNAVWVEKELFDALFMYDLVTKKGAWIDISDIVQKWIDEANKSIDAENEIIKEKNKKNKDGAELPLSPRLELKSKHQGLEQFSDYFEANPKVLKVVLDRIKALHA
jgi:hypothetical protein